MGAIVHGCRVGLDRVKECGGVCPEAAGQKHQRRQRWDDMTVLDRRNEGAAQRMTGLLL